MPPKKKDEKTGGKSKQIQAAKAAAGGGKSSGGKGKKKKWSKGKVREKLSNAVVFDKATYDKLIKEVPSYRLITPAVVSERLKVNGSLARRGIQELLNKGLIRPVAIHAKSKVYTRAIVKEEEPVETTKAGAAKAAAKSKKPAAKKEAAAEKPAAEAPKTEA